MSQAPTMSGIAIEIVEWKCVGCGGASSNCVRSCECATDHVYRVEKGRMVTERKIPNFEDWTALSRLWKAIVDNTTGDMFWIGELLLHELEKETGFKPDQHADRRALTPAKGTEP